MGQQARQQARLTLNVNASTSSAKHADCLEDTKRDHTTVNKLICLHSMLGTTASRHSCDGDNAHTRLGPRAALLLYPQVEWHEDLRKVLKMAGEANKRVVFLFADTQIKSESFVEDISNLLNTYEVPNLLQPADLATTFENICPRAKAAGLDGNKDQLYTFFLQEVPLLSCLHL